MVDIDNAVIGRGSSVSYALHVSEAITTTNIAHGGSALGLSKNEGFIFASEDPVALDLFAARYLYKNVPRGTVPGHPFAMFTPFGNAAFDADSKTVVSEGGYEFPVENDPLFAYAESRGLGTRRYHVAGIDMTASGAEEALLASKEGHFGRMVFSGDPAPSRPYVFKEIITQLQQGAVFPHYVSLEGPIWPLQNSFKSLASAADTQTFSTFLSIPGYRAMLEASDLDRDGRLSFGDDANDIESIFGVSAMGSALAARGQMERGQFHSALKLIKYREPAWNSQGAGRKTELTTMSMAVALALQPPSSLTADQFFGGTACGYGSDGKLRWPSLQWARFLYEVDAFNTGYKFVTQYATKMGYTFKLLMPSFLPYFLFAPNPFLLLGLSGVEQTSNPDDMFVAKFYNQSGQEVEKW
jgi:hypothetical protein